MRPNWQFSAEYDEDTRLGHMASAPNDNFRQLQAAMHAAAYFLVQLGRIARAWKICIFEKNISGKYAMLKVRAGYA